MCALIELERERENEREKGTMSNAMWMNDIHDSL